MTIRTPDVASSPSTTGALCVPVVCRPAKGMRSSAAVQGESRCKRPACGTDRTACCRREREDRNPFDEPDHLLLADSGYMCKAFSRLRGVDPDQPERAAREPKVRRLPAGGRWIRTIGTAAQKPVDSHSIPGMARDRRALKRYHLQPFFFCASNHGVPRPPGRFAGRGAHSPPTGERRQLSDEPATFNDGQQPVADLGRAANGIHDLAGNAIPPNQVAAGRLCVQGAIIGCDRDDPGRLDAKTLCQTASNPGPRIGIEKGPLTGVGAGLSR